PKLNPETHDDGSARVYIWKHSHLEPSKPQGKKTDAEESEPLKVQLTTFKNWEEVGSWWTALASPQAAVTPAIQQKASEITSGLSSEAEKARVIYKYVAMRFRYISISLGMGRYRPHSAEEVLANQYGDCKDKHTLFAALLKAAGIQAWPALIGAGLKLDAAAPSPAQFNHVVTVLREDGKYVWLDTTAEVAPFGLLNQVIRDEQALVIPTAGKAFLLKTPADPPFPTSNTVEVSSSLAADGTLKAHFDLRMEGDFALALRSGFRQLSPLQWQTLAQQISYSFGYAGEVSGVEVENLEDIEKPFHYSYDYSRKNYSDWEEHKITVPLPPATFGPGDEAEKPKEAFWSGAPGASTYRSSMRLPPGFSLEVPADTRLASDFADYSAHYSLKDGTLFTERKMAIKESKIAVDQWAAYQKFSKGVQADQTTFLSLSSTEAEATKPTIKERSSESNPEAEQLLNRAAQAMHVQTINEARDLVAQAERVNPKEARLWAMKGYLAMISGQREEAITDCRKEIQFHPDEIPAYQELSAMLLRAGRREDAIETLRTAVAASPENETVATMAAMLLMEVKRYAEVLPILEKAIAAQPQNYHLRSLRTRALLEGDQKEQGLAEAQAIAKATSEPTVLNDLAYNLAETDTAMGTAEAWAQKASSQTEQDCAHASLTTFEQKDLQAVNLLAAEWDTLGWVYFKEGDASKAERYVDAAWLLSQNADVADHLGQIYEKQGNQAEAIHMWRLALASKSDHEDSKERLRKAGVPLSEPITRSAAKSGTISAGEELGKLRTIKIPELPKQTGAAEFFILLSKGGIEDVRVIGASDALKGAESVLGTTKYEFPFPDEGPEKIIRRGILSCSTYTAPSCQFTMLLPSTTTTAQAKEPQ
ncbi:MAG: transglutaminase domain-containing protein, partial [Bryobacteraceae bacterium]